MFSVKVVNLETIIDLQSWCRTWPLNGSRRIRENKNFTGNPEKLAKNLEPDRKPKVIYTDNSLEFGKAYEDLSWNHCTSTPHRSETNGIAERAVRRVKKVPVLYCCNQVWMKINWWADSMECYTCLRTSQIYYPMGRRPMKTVLGNHLKDLLCHLVHWLSITLSLRRTSQESINLERKLYLDCSSDTLSTRWEFGRVTYWSQTLRSWRRWTHRKSTRKDLMRQR